MTVARYLIRYLYESSGWLIVQYPPKHWTGQLCDGLLVPPDSMGAHKPRPNMVTAPGSRCQKQELSRRTPKHEGDARLLSKNAPSSTKGSVRRQGSREGITTGRKSTPAVKPQMMLYSHPTSSFAGGTRGTTIFDLGSGADGLLKAHYDTVVKPLVEKTRNARGSHRALSSHGESRV